MAKSTSAFGNKKFRKNRGRRNQKPYNRNDYKQRQQRT